MRAYFPSVIKQVVYNKYLPEIRDTITRLPKNKQFYAEELISTVLGKPQWYDVMMENFLKQNGVEVKSPLTKADIAVSNGLYRGILGLNPVSAVKNLSQTVNTMSEIGVLPTLEGMARLTTKKGRALIKEHQVLDDWQNIFEKDVSIKNNVDGVIFSPMSGSEYLNRGFSFLGTYHKVLRSGATQSEAVAKALATTQETQFVYGKLGKSPFIDKVPFGRTFTMFTSFPRKQIEFLNHLRKDNKAGLFRYMGILGLATTLMGGKAAMNLLVPKPSDALPIPKEGNPGYELLMGTLGFQPKRVLRVLQSFIPGNTGIIKPLTK